MPRKTSKRAAPATDESRVIAGFRLPAALVARLDAMVEAQQKEWPETTRNAVIRKALAAGLDVLETQNRKGAG